jgi:hypothetical protein
MNKPEHRDESVGRALLDLPTPARSPSFFIALRETLTATPKLAANRHRKTGMHLRPRKSLALLAASIATALAVGAVLGATFAKPGRGATTQSTAVVSFQPALGWNTVETNVASDSTAPQVAWAANIPFKTEELSGFPDNTVRAMPPDGIVIVVVGPRDYTGGENFPHLNSPIQLSDGFFTADNYEGQPAANVSRYVIDGFVGGKLVNVLVWLGATQPTPAMIKSANDELGRLGIPEA